MGSGDVKYHMGYGSELTTPTDKTVHVKLMPNPSHLEAVDPVVVTPVVLVPAPASGTAKPAVRAKFPPLVIGSNHREIRRSGEYVSGKTVSTGRRHFRSGPDVGSRLTAELAALHR